MSQVQDVMYIVASGKDAIYCDYLRAVDLTTAQTTNVREMPDRALMMGIYVGPAAVEDEAVPNVVSDLSLNFDKASLEGVMQFTLPVNLYGGPTGTSQLGYTVYRNGEVVKDVAPHDSVKWGSIVTLKEVVPALGKYTYYVKAKNRSGEGPRAEETLWVGNDYPASVGTPLLEYSADSLRFNISWTAPKKSANGGYIDLSKLTYNVYDKDGKKIATGLTECKYTVPEANPEAVDKWMFTVTAVHEGLESNSKNTNTIGFNTAPLYEPWDVAARFEEWTVLDVNKDYRTWEFPYYYASKGYVFVLGNSSEKKGMDDWLITPPIKLEKDKEYDLYVAANTSNVAAPHSFEIGLGADIKPMTNIILETQKVTSTDSVSYKCTFRTDSTGIYYIGLHANSDGYRGSLQVLDFALEAGASLNAPGLGKFAVSPDRKKFTLTADVEYETPSKTVDGKELKSISKVEFYRDDVLVKTVENPAPGSKVTFNDAEGITLGDHRWRAIPYNEAGAGKNIVVTEYVGVYQTTAPTDIRVVETDDKGTVNISWKAPQKDVMGNDIPANLIRYNLYSKAGTPITRNIDATTVTVSSTTPDQNFVYFMLTSTTDAGENRESVAYSSIVAVGTPYKLPFVETCGSMIIGHNWGLSAVDGGNKWQLAGGCDSPVCHPQDNDGGMWAWIPKYLDDMSMVYSGKIAITGTNPTLSFFYRAMKGSEDKIDVAVRVMGDEKWTVIKSFPLSAPGIDDWAKGFVSLNDYVGKKVQVAWIGYSKKADAVLCMDNMRIEQVWANNMQINKLSAPNRVGVAEEYAAVATVENMGTEAAQGVTVSLLRDGEVVATSPAADYAVGERAEVELRDKTLNMFAKDKSVYQVVVNYAADENPEDNKSANVEVAVEKSNAPVVNDLVAAEDAGKFVALKWTAPEVESNPSDIVTDDFENYTPWETANVGKWTLFTGNNSIRAYSGIPYPNSLTPYPFIVFDTTYPGFSKSDYTPYSGTQYMAAFCCEYGANDDWLVSPELNGIKQTVSFMARSFTLDYGSEELEFLYSVKGKDRADFVKVAEVHDVPVQWTKYTYEIPEGAKYFAIRCVSNDRLALLI
ncbi:MAG: choice-of-anchor J domain-containing protein, partial [Muribaculaceae bacterium]|nr:choice-of-anchor J domain-containing protein [Muribaculaceae bacterium]